MVFLDFFNPEWLSSVPDGILGSIIKALRTLCFSLDTIIYKLIIGLYDMFHSFCTVRLLSNDLLRTISERIGIILGIVMLFFIVLSFVQMLLNPDVTTDKEKGAISVIKKTIIVIVLLGSSSFLFNALYEFQRMVVESNVISRILLPYSVEVSVNNESNNSKDESLNAVMDDKKFGALLSEELLMSFYKLEEFDETAEITTDDESTYLACKSTINAFRTQIINYSRFDLGYNCLNEDIMVSFKVDDENSSYSQETSMVSFNWLLSVVVGVFVAYMIFMYCFKVGIRMIQLMFLEIISPMAFVSYLSPKKDTMLDKWKKIYFSTYIDVFIRIAIINFIFFLIATLFSTDSGLGFKFSESMSNVSGYTKSFYTIVIILALLTFAKKAPDLLKSLFPEGDSKLGFGASMKDIVGLKTGTSIVGGAVGGAAIGLLSMSPGGAIGGFLKGGFSGLKGQGFSKTAAGAWKSEKDSIKKMRDIRANGGSWFGSRIASVQGALGIRNAYERDETSIANAQMIVDTYNDAESEAKSEVIKNRANYSMTSFDGSAHSLAEYEALKTDQRLTSSERAKYGIEYDRLLKSATQFTLDYGAAMENGIAAFDNSGNFTDAMDYATGTVYNTVDIDSMSTADRETLMGATNAKIEVGMAKLGGKPHSGRGSSNKKQRNDNSTYIHTLKNSKEYKSHKTNAGK